MKIILPGTERLYDEPQPIPDDSRLISRWSMPYEVLSTMFQKLRGDVAIRDRLSFDPSRRLSVSILVNISSVLSTAFSSLLPALDLNTCHYHVFAMK